MFFFWQSLHGPKKPLPSCIHPSSYIFRMILLPCFSRCLDLKFTAHFFMWQHVHPFPTLFVSYAPDVLIYGIPLFLITSQNYANCTDFTLNFCSVLKHPAALDSFSLGGIMTCYQKCLITTRSKPSLISFVTSEQFFVISYKLYAKVLFMIGCQRKSHVCFRNFLLFYSISIDSVLVAGIRRLFKMVYIPHSVRKRHLQRFNFDDIVG